MKKTILAILCALGYACLWLPAVADDLVLVAERSSDFQVVTPKASDDDLLDACLHETARLIQAAFAANEVEVPIVAEGARNPDVPAIFLGATEFARNHGVDVSKFDGWNYCHKVVGPNVIIAGRDHAPPNITVKNLGSTSQFSCRLGTLKATADFLRTHAGTRFLFPGAQSIPTQVSKSLRPWSFDGADIEFGSWETLAIPDDLDLQKEVFTRNHRRHRTATLYDIANNFFPNVDDAAIGHTWDKAVTVEEYRDDHPEYFAMIGGERTRDGQYCLSNEEFRELVYQFHKRVLDQGAQSVNILQPDGFRACQCEPCQKLYGVESWGEKIWLFHREIALRLEKECPARKLLMTAYTVTKEPPTSFEEFPDNIIIQTVDAINAPTETFTRWTRRHRGEFGIWLHNWIGNQTSRYTPMRTPLFVSEQVRFFHKYNTRSVFRDGLGEVFGLEGPTYYIFGRMFDDPANLEAKELMIEFCDAAFGEGAPSMIRFYDQLNHAIELYSQYIGTHGVGWGYHDIYGRRHKHVKDPFRMLGFLYTPKLIEAMEIELARAEQRARRDKPRARLALVRREFDYLKHLTKVVHLCQAYRIAPSLSLRGQLLDAVDARNEEIDSYYVQEGRYKGRPMPFPGWDNVLFPPPGHAASHLRLAYNRYQEPFEDTVFNWDTAEVRKTPLPGTQQLRVPAVSEPPTVESAQWKEVPSGELEGSSQKTTFQVLHDDQRLYIRVDAELSVDAPDFEKLGEDADLSERESIDVYLAPLPGRDIFNRFTVGPHEASRFDAASGLIDDVLNLLYDKDDPSWDGDWTYQSHLDRANRRWVALLTIPWQTLGTEAPERDAAWRFNLGRTHRVGGQSLERSIWSQVGGTRNVGDRNALGQLIFGAASSSGEAKNELQQWREDYYRETFEIPEEWKDEDAMRLADWKFRIDPLEKGAKEGWNGVDLDESAWLTMPVPSFWAEQDEVGQYEGIAWYRTTINIPAEWKGSPIRILFGSVDEQAWVYVNGKLIREFTENSEGKPFGELWEIPFHADVPTDLVKPEQTNVLAVRVRNSKANGGLWRPVLVRLGKSKD